MTMSTWHVVAMYSTAESRAYARALCPPPPAAPLFRLPLDPPQQPTGARNRHSTFTARRPRPLQQADTPTKVAKVSYWPSRVDTGGGATHRPPALAVLAMRAGADVTPAAASARGRERMDALTLVPRPQPQPSPSPWPWSGRLPRRRARAAS